MAYVVFNLLAAAALIGIDQAIKLWATNVLQPVGAMPLIPHVVELRFVLNPVSYTHLTLPTTPYV